MSSLARLGLVKMGSHFAVRITTLFTSEILALQHNRQFQFIIRLGNKNGLFPNAFSISSRTSSVINLTIPTLFTAS